MFNLLRDPTVKNNIGAPNLLQENRAIKRQKLEGGNSRQVHVIAILHLLFH